MPFGVETSAVEELRPVLPSWTDPVLECYETRPEVTAYAADGGPWNAR
ncbi:MAG: hypothetical protein QOI78_8100 [Actinomycetota bacterium]|jgi:hypothetical protein|nr:hypothetical protein [Actinomycetota bacterium]